MDYIYDWTTGTDLKRRVKKNEEKTSENNSEENENENENEKNNEKDLESNNHDQIDKIVTRQIKRNDTHEISRERGGEDKVESVCCNM